MQTIKEAAKELMGTQVGMWDFGMKLVEFAQRWIPVEEQLPEENVFVLCINPFSPFVASYHGKEKGFRIPNTEGEYKVTHWRPIEYPIL